MLARYHLEHELGTGARGAVFRGRDKTSGCVVAVKLVPHELSDEGPGCARALEARSREAAVAHLAHPNIVTIRESVSDGRLRWIVMELAHGGDLGAHVREGNLLPLRSVLCALEQVAGALHHAHERGVVHGDVKPANIVFDAGTDIVKLTDFPSCVAEAGTPAYLSPERLCGLSASEASDQYALGVTLYQLACGHLPFSGKSWPEIAHRVVHASHTDIRTHVDTLPAGLAAIFDTVFAKTPALRYPSMRELGGAMRRMRTALGAAGQAGIA